MESEEVSAGSYASADDHAPVPAAIKGAGRKNRGDGKRKRRFSDQQIRSLECTFEAQTKLEPRKKLELAGELGLQPRQVAVWFQNKRARWKSKQLESEYAALRAEYESLLSSFRSLEKEKQSLGKELQELKERLGRPPAGAGGGWDLRGGEEEDEEGGKAKPGCASMEQPPDLTLMLSAAEGEGVLPEEQQQVSGLCEGSTDPLVDGSALGSSCRPCRLDVGGGGGFSDQSCGSCSDWWEFWPLNE